MNKKISIVIIVVILSIIGLSWLVSRISQETDPTTGTGSTARLNKAPNFSLKDYNGNTVSLADFQDMPLVINTWAAWCPFCVKELPVFAAAQKEFQDQVVVIAIDRAESLNTAKKFSDKVGVTNELILLLDPSDSFYKSIAGFSMPETIFVDKDGNIQHHKRGAMDLDELRQKIQNLLAN